jgi:hypothetical protein
MNIDRISPSSYTKWESCQQAYFIEQNLKYTYPPGVAADMGTVVHKVLEYLALIKLGQQEKQTELETSKGSIEFDNYSIAQLEEMAASAYKNLTKEHYKTITKCVQNALSYADGEYDPRNREIIAPERRVKIEIQEDWAVRSNGERYCLSGIIDLVTKTPTGYEIIDWKTGALKDWNTGKVKTYQDFYDDPQLRFYHYAATKIYGEEHAYKFTIFFVKENKAFTVPFDNSDLGRTLYLLKDRFLEIQNTQVPQLNRTWKCTKFCPYGQKTAYGTNLPALTQISTGGIAKIGSPMTICDCVSHQINTLGIDYVEANMGKNSKKNA